MCINTRTAEVGSQLIAIFLAERCGETENLNNKGRDICHGQSALMQLAVLARAPVSVGACPDADEGGGKDGETENSCENCLIHTCSLVSASGALALHEGLSVCVFSGGGYEVLTQPSRSLALMCGPGLRVAPYSGCGGTQCFHDLLRI